MTQIMFLATTSTTVAYGTGITTLGVQVLPAWAPPIEYIGTTTPWLAYFMGASTITGDILGGGKYVRKEHVRTYGRQANLHSGAEVFSVRSRVENAGNKKPMIVLTYRAVGETTRP
jgi:hypothetical protein